MNYVVVLNWNSAEETIACIKSLFSLNNFNETRLIICDNDSAVESYNKIKIFLSELLEYDYVELTEQESENYSNSHQIYFIKNERNYGYAGGNNRGIKFALQFSDIENVWILNNDTIIKPDSLEIMIYKMSIDSQYGVIGSRLVELENKKSVQGIGGIINPLICTTKEIGKKFTIDDKIDENEFEAKIDYVIGASLLISRNCLDHVGLLCEDYFLYYEEIDYCNRAKQQGFKIGIASESIVFHEHGVSTGKGKSNIADYYSVRSRLFISKKFYSKYFVFTYFSLFLILFNRIRRFELEKGLNIIRILVNYKKDFK